MVKIVAVGSRVDVPCVVPVHVRRRVAETPEAVHVAAALPRPYECTLARALHGLLQTTRYWVSSGQRCVSMPSASGHELVCVELSEGDEVCVSLGHLVAFSESIVFRTVIDLAIASLSVRQTFQQIAKGPGIVVFDCAGPPTIFEGRSACEGKRVQIGRLIMWPRGVEFRLDTVHSRFDLYFGEIRVFLNWEGEPAPVILDVEERDTQRNSLWKQILSFYKPW